MAFGNVHLGYGEAGCSRLSFSGGGCIPNFKIYPRILFLESLQKDLSAAKNLTVSLQDNHSAALKLLFFLRLFSDT